MITNQTINTLKGICFTIAFSFLFALSVQAQNGSMNKISVPESDSTGRLVFNTEVDSFYVVIDDDFKNVRQYASGESIRVKAGKHKVRLVKKYYRDLITRVEMVQDTNIVIKTNLLPFRNFENYKYYSSYPRIHWQATFVVKTDPDAKLYVDGNYIGKGIGRIDTLKPFTVKSELPSGQAIYETFSPLNQLYTFHVRELYHRPEKKKSKFLSLLPGGSQIYHGEKWKGFALLGTALAGTALAIKYQVDYSDKYEEFRLTKRQYEQSLDPQRVFELGNRADQQLRDASAFANFRDGLIYGTLGIYLYSLVDGMLKPDIGYRKKIEVDPYIDFNPDFSRRIGISTAYNF